MKKSMLNLSIVAAMVVAISALIPGTPVLAAVKGEVVKYTVDGQEFTGYIAHDTSVAGKRPGVVVVHEWWGHDAYARQRADLLAARGYTAIALDMYGTGKQADHPKTAGAFMKEAIANADRMRSRFQAAYSELLRHATVNPAKTAAIGYCFGGKVVLDMARLGVDLDGVVSFHGNLTPIEKAKPGMTKAKVRVFNGADDKFVKPESISALRAEMAGAGVDLKIVNYPGVVHSFTSPSATARGKKFKLPLAYNAHADGDSWRQTMHFFDEIFN